MSPRQIVDVSCECPHVECVQYYSTSRGLLRRTVICRHPENAGCVCVLETADVAECQLCPAEETQTIHIEVEASCSRREATRRRRCLRNQ